MLLSKTVLCIGGSRGCAGHTPPPTEPNSFIFTHIFAKKCLRLRSVPPPNGSTPPLQEILDPPLLCKINCQVTTYLSIVLINHLFTTQQSLAMGAILYCMIFSKRLLSMLGLKSGLHKVRCLP